MMIYYPEGHFLDLNKDKNKLPNKSGLYYLYNKKYKLIYVGISRHIKKRVLQHFWGNCTPKSKLLRKQMKYVIYYLMDFEWAEKIERLSVDRVLPFFNIMPPSMSKQKEKVEIYIIFPWEKPYFYDNFARLEFRDAQRDKTRCIQSSHIWLGIPRDRELFE